MNHRPNHNNPQVLIIGCGFGGLEAVRTLSKAQVNITLIDRTNHHLFQPLLYQVATAGLAAPAVAEPIRRILARQMNTTVLYGEARRVDLAAHRVVLENGEELRAPLGVTCIHPKIAFLDLIGREELPADFVWDIERWRTRSGVVKINVAMSELPDFIADPGKEMQDHHTGSVELCFTPQYAEEAFQDSHMGRKPSVRPFVDGVIPTTLDKKLAPEGVHVFSMFTQWVPDDWNLEPHRDGLEQYADRIIDLYTELAPNFKGAVIDRQVLGPYDMEQELGLIGGNIFHGELSVDQLFHMRPAPGYADYRTPIKGLYHGSSATHAGGGVNGIPGWQAYRAAVRDRAVKKPR